MTTKHPQIFEANELKDTKWVRELLKYGNFTGEVFIDNGYTYLCYEYHDETGLEKMMDWQRERNKIMRERLSKIMRERKTEHKNP